MRGEKACSGGVRDIRNVKGTLGSEVWGVPGLIVINKTVLSCIVGAYTTTVK